MGNCLSPKPAEKDANDNTKFIEDKLRTEHREDSTVHKLLLLGPGESGKSTLFKQMFTIYGTGFTEKDKKSYLPIIFRNIVSCVKELAKQSTELPKKDETLYSACRITDPTVQKAQEFINDVKIEDGTITPEVVKATKILWANAAIQETYNHRSRYQLPDSCSWFLERCEEVSKAGYLPTEEDILRVRARTTGIVEHDFIIDRNRFKMIDVGGQRNERKKWIHCFEKVTAVIFVVDLSAFDCVLYEDEKVNRMEEALNLFENICNSRWFRDTSIILFLNKSDLFKDKIKRVQLKDTFPEYTGENTYEAVTAFFEQEFLKRNHYKKPIYCHVTCATNKQNVSVLFNGVKDILLRESLDRAGLM